jgi:hypothetical protein
VNSIDVTISFFYSSARHAKSEGLDRCHAVCAHAHTHHTLATMRATAPSRSTTHAAAARPRSSHRLAAPARALVLLRAAAAGDAAAERDETGE